jgi:diadenosine tetraphosphatase ApaH/serine/threonine PP2A family protein phosphatase
MNKERTIIIGDVHGCYNELVSLLTKCNFSKKHDRLIFVGDLVDRGPYSSDVIDYVMDIEAECIMGNHDWKYVKHYKNRKDKHQRSLHPEKAKIYRTLSDENLKWLSSLPHLILLEDRKLIICHGGVPLDTNPLHGPRDGYYYARYVDTSTHKQRAVSPPQYEQPQGSQHWTALYKNTYFNVIYGHHVHDLVEPFFTKNDNAGYTVGIDTGCCFGGKLTAAIFESEHQVYPLYEQVDALRVYKERITNE